MVKYTKEYLKKNKNHKMVIGVNYKNTIKALEKELIDEQPLIITGDINAKIKNKHID